METEGIATVKLTETEIHHIVWGMTVIKTMRLPLDPEWKNPYLVLLDDFKRIQENMKLEKENKVDNYDSAEEERLGPSPRGREE